jgi:mono/diheme cytochrome c family protein
MKYIALPSVMLLALVLVDCKHSPAPKRSDSRPVDDCLSLLDTGEGLTMDTPFMPTGPVVAVDGEEIPAASFRRYSTLYADAKTPREPAVVRRAFANYVVGQRLADEAGVEATRARIEQRYASVEARFPDADTFEQFLADSGLTQPKLQAVICRDLRLAEYVRTTDATDVTTAHVRALLSQPDVQERIELLESQIRSSLTEEYDAPSTQRYVSLSQQRGGWTAVIYDGGSDLHELEHDSLMLFQDDPMAVHFSGTGQYVAYLSEDRVILATSSERVIEDQMQVEGVGDDLALRSDNRAGAFWVPPLGTLPLVDIDILRREGLQAPAVTPRGEELGQTLVYTCADEPTCSDERFEVDVLTEDDARTWAIYQYPAIDGGAAYARNCATCHGDQGQGVDGTHPPLLGTRWTTGELGELALIEAVVLGNRAPSLQGDTEVLGERHSSDLMPAYADHLDPREVTEIINYVTRSWGNDGPRVSEQQVIDVYCDHGHEVVYDARLDAGEMRQRLQRARSTGDCGADVREDLETLAEPVSDEVEERGERIYDASCAACHGKNGEGDVPAGQVLQPAATDFTDPSRWKHGRDLTSAYISIAEGIEHTAMASYADELDHDELQLLAQMVVEWLPEEARRPPAGEDVYLEYCRVETERRRLMWDRCREH